MRQTLVAGNWKMNGSKESIRALIDGIVQGMGAVTKTEMVICPPYVYLSEVEAQIRGRGIALGGQNVSEQASGAFTGEISAQMLSDLGCKYAIVGHSERRTIYGEGDALVAKKFIAAREVGLKPILCVGELLEEREGGRTEAVVARQIDAVLDAVGINGLTGSVIAYEPVWAIGTGKTATSEQAQEVHAFIRQRLARHDTDVAAHMQILYGGSVKASNAAELFGMDDIDGGLIGGASLKAEEFLAICG